MTPENEFKIYRRWKEKQGNIQPILKEFGISRSSLYGIISRIDNGDGVKIEKCLALGRLNCLWSFKHQPKYMSLPENREKNTVLQIKKLIKEMSKDGFSQVSIAELLRKDRSTIIHHLCGK